MRLRFWRWVHDWLERAWHWVYYNKIAPKRPAPLDHRGDYVYSVKFLNSKGEEVPPTYY